MGILCIEELLELDACVHADGEDLLETVGNHVGDGERVGEAGAEREAGEGADVLLEGFEDFFGVDVDDVFFEDGAWVSGAYR